ncbi:MAG: DJ-1/PfpI family protein [Methanocellales archaeon]|nr:DJ-1/PfpI family protein [Methanocellales archaeon]
MMNQILESLAILSLVVLILSSGCIEKPEMNLAGKSVLMVIAPENFRDEELSYPKRIFEDAGARVVIASKITAPAKGMLGMETTPDISLDQVVVDDYGAIIFVGGSGARTYFDDSRVHSIAKEAYEQGKIVAAICIAPVILANADILDGKNATVFSSEISSLELRGAHYTGESVTQDGNIVTANGPAASKQFAEKIAEMLS